MMDGIPWQRDFRTIKDRGFVHIVPDEQEWRGVLPHLEIKHLRPPIPAVGIEEIYPDRRARPAPSLKVGTIRFLDQDIQLFRFGEHSE